MLVCHCREPAAASYSDKFVSLFSTWDKSNHTLIEDIFAAVGKVCDK
jgi:hypothetical protein